ncbi:mevalonate kinase [Nilaparvata lugens]|uniref:mevalonate kinase n=1 Tax=Nilaparvata lugens TaxID=108931 RepID=UPI00193D5C69|nr:mevalonate kinase [Nilaparvata lugens]
MALIEGNRIKINVSAPGKLILFGEHSVVYGKTALAASIDRRTTLELCEKIDNHIKITMNKIDLNVTLNFSDVLNIVQETVSETDHDIYARSILDRMSRVVDVSNLTDQQKSSLLVFILLLHLIFHANSNLLQPFTIEVDSELTLGAGTGSSASYCVCVSAALLHYKNLKLSSDFNKKSFSPEYYNKINEFAYAGERILHGRPSGLDNTVCVNGSFVEMNRSGTSKFVVLENAPLIDLILINSGVPRNTSQLVQKVAALKKRNPSAVDNILNAMDDVSKTASVVLKKIGVCQRSSAPFDEDFQRLEELIVMNQGLLSSLGVSHRSLDDICMICNEHGLKAKLTGAGGGGFAFTILPPNFDEGKLNACLEKLKSHSYQCSRVVLGGERVCIESSLY